MTKETKKTITRDEMFARLELAKVVLPQVAHDVLVYLNADRSKPGASVDPADAAVGVANEVLSPIMEWVMNDRDLEQQGGCGCKDKKPKPQERADLLASQLQELVKNAIKVSGNLTVRDYIHKGHPALSRGEHDFVAGVLYAHGLRPAMPEDALHKWIMNDK